MINKKERRTNKYTKHTNDAKECGWNTHVEEVSGDRHTKPELSNRHAANTMIKKMQIVNKERNNNIYILGKPTRKQQRKTLKATTQN